MLCHKCKRKATVQFSRIAHVCDVIGDASSTHIEVVAVDMCTQHGNDMFKRWNGSVEKVARFKPTLTKLGGK